jgi:hypothetical protein
VTSNKAAARPNKFFRFMLLSMTFTGQIGKCRAVWREEFMMLFERFR